MNKTYYQRHLAQLKAIKGRPSLLIHICCGVCSVYPLEYLRKYFDITIYFTNSNIYPFEEYELRLNALRKYLQILKDPSIKLIDAKYDNESYMQDLEELKDEKEGGKRCYRCYGKRMLETCLYANKHHYDYWTSVMSISNRKNADWINEIGEKLYEEYPQSIYLYADFKKGDGIIRNDEMNHDLGLYHQNYCGCVYSKR